MDKADFTRYQDLIVSTATNLGIKVLAAIAFWVIGRWLIGTVVSLVRRSLEKQKMDPTVLRYVGSIITVTLNVLLVIGILGYFGIQTTTFAALIAAAGVAIGVAAEEAATGWTRSNFFQVFQK
jgi:small conductance mechanosensitive channel